VGFWCWTPLSWVPVTAPCHQSPDLAGELYSSQRFPLRRSVPGATASNMDPANTPPGEGSVRRAAPAVSFPAGLGKHRAEFRAEV